VQGDRAAANGLRPSTKLWLALSAVAIMLMMSAADVVASDLTTTKASSMPVASHDWSGFYVGGHVGYAAASSNWNSEALGARTLSGSTEIFDDNGPWGPIFSGLQAGYNYVLAPQLLVGVSPFPVISPQRDSYRPL
jgi:high affinity Mn2+ porin